MQSTALLAAIVSMPLLFAGCSTERVVFQRAEIPVPVRCELYLPARPASAVESNTSATLPDKTAAIISDLEATRRYADELDAVLKKCVDRKVK